jgi:hypothetical protein
MTAKRMRNGCKAKTAAGGYAGYGSPALGQHSIDGELADDQAEQAVIERMRELRGAGLSYRLIAARLNAEGLKSKRGGDCTRRPSHVPDSVRAGSGVSGGAVIMAFVIMLAVRS